MTSPPPDHEEYRCHRSGEMDQLSRQMTRLWKAVGEQDIRLRAIEVAQATMKGKIVGVAAVVGAAVSLIPTILRSLNGGP